MKNKLFASALFIFRSPAPFSYTANKKIRPSQASQRFWRCWWGRVIFNRLAYALDLVLNFWTHHPSAQSQCSPAVFKPPVPLPPQTSRVCSGAHTWALLRHGSKRGHLLLLSVQHLTGRSLPLHMDYRLRLPPLPSPQSHSLLTFGAADHMVRRIGGIFFFTWPDALLFLAKPSALARHYPDYPVLTNIIDSWVLRVTVASMLMVINQRACVSAQGWTGARQMEILSAQLFSVIITFCHTDLQTQRSAPLYRVEHDTWDTS